MPRWIGTLLDVMGRRSASFVNYDLFQNQGIPPMAVLVSGGTLTDESLEELELVFRSARGLSQFNRVLLLESILEGAGIDDKGSAKIDLKNLSEYRKEDQMFDRYLKHTEKAIRHRYRLPPLHVGAAETFTHATAKSARTVAEEQVFVPERLSFDEAVNNELLVPELQIGMWTYKSKGPRIAGADELSKGVETFAKAGAISVNHAIDRANDAFGTQMSKYDQPWADYPITVVIEMLKAGALTLEGLGEIPPPPNTGGRQGQLPGLPQKVLKSDMFNPAEKKLYKQMLLLQSMAHALTPEEIDDLPDL
jgi:capsid portal protein